VDDEDNRQDFVFCAEQTLVHFRVLSSSHGPGLFSLPAFKSSHWRQGFDNLLSRISRLVLLNPLAVSVTWGAGGSTKDKSIQLASLTQNDHNLTTLLHLTCTNAELGQVDAVLQVCVS